MVPPWGNSETVESVVQRCYAMVVQHHEILEQDLRTNGDVSNSVFPHLFQLEHIKKNQSKQKLKKKWYSLHDFMLLQIKSMAPGAKRWPGFFWRPWAPQVEDCRNLYKGTKWLYYCRGWTNQIRGYRVQIFAIEMTSKLPGLSKNACHPSVNICKHSQWEAYLGEAARLKTQAFFIIIFFWNFAYKPIPKTNSDPAYLTEEANFHISTQRRRKLLAGEVGGRNRSFEVSSIRHLANTCKYCAFREQGDGEGSWGYIQ